MKAVVTFGRTDQKVPEIIETDLGGVHITVTTDDGDVVAAGPLEAFLDLSSTGIQAMREYMVPLGDGR